MTVSMFSSIKKKEKKKRKEKRLSMFNKYKLKHTESCHLH